MLSLSEEEYNNLTTHPHLCITIKKVNSCTGATECNNAFICMQIT